MHENDWGPLHLVGHSLGAHICGFAAKELKKRQSKWKIERITGLDPAQPCFRDVNLTMKLHKSDASFVDVIHTNGKLLSQMGLGLPEPIGLTICTYIVICSSGMTLKTNKRFTLGHVDFYPNGGRSQPGCNSSFFEHLPIHLQGMYRYSNNILIHWKERCCLLLVLKTAYRCLNLFSSYKMSNCLWQ